MSVTQKRIEINTLNGSFKLKWTIQHILLKADSVFIK